MPAYNLEYTFQPTSELPFGSFVVFLQESKGALRLVYRQIDKSDDFMLNLLIDDVPIIEWQEKNGCPTCDQLLRSGNPEFDNKKALASIQEVDINYIEGNQFKWFERYIPILDLCESGFYFVTCYDYYPTDGDGHLFWGSYDELSLATAVNFGTAWGSEYCPRFLISSQSTSKFSTERFEKAKNLYQNTPGIAYHLEGYLSVLLDGHHRALAAAEVGKTFPCVTISRASWMWEGGNGMDGLPDYIVAPFDLKISTNGLSEDAKSWLIKNSQPKGNKVREKFTIHSDGFSENFKRVKDAVDKKIRVYPTHQDFEASADAGSISSEDIEKAFRSQCVYPSLGTVLTALFIRRDDRMRALALRVLKTDAWESLWSKALQYLSDFRDDEIKDLFMDFATRDIKHTDLTAIVDAYLTKNVDLYR